MSSVPAITVPPSIIVMLSQVRKLYLSYLNPNRKNDERSPSFDKALGSECVVIQNVETATTKNAPVEESEPPRKPMKKHSALPWSNILLCVIICGVALLLSSPIIVFYLPRDLLGLDEVRLVSRVYRKAKLIHSNTREDSGLQLS